MKWQQKCFLRSDMSPENDLLQKVHDLEKENKVLKVKCAASLANNLCSDHRDKQTFKSCLACEIERLTKWETASVKALHEKGSKIITLRAALLRVLQEGNIAPGLLCGVQARQALALGETK